MQIFGYMRISTQKERQTTDRQRVTLESYAESNGFQFDELIEERISGTVKSMNRPQYKRLRDKLRSGDILIVTDIDRLGRNADDVIMEFKKLKADEIRIIALDTPYLNEWNKVNDSSLYDMIADIFITLKAHMAQSERENTVQRINEGIKAMPTNEEGKKVGRSGKVSGRPKAELPRNFSKEYKKFKDGNYGKMSALAFAKMLGIGRSTLYKYIKIYDEENRIYTKPTVREKEIADNVAKHGRALNSCATIINRLSENNFNQILNRVNDPSKIFIRHSNELLVFEIVYKGNELNIFCESADMYFGKVSIDESFKNGDITEEEYEKYSFKY